MWWDYAVGSRPEYGHQSIGFVEAPDEATAHQLILQRYPKWCIKYCMTKKQQEAVTRLEKWVAAELRNPAPEGGRNNQIIQVAPRMLELGWDEDTILEAFQTAFDCKDGSKDTEILAAIRSATRYITEIAEDHDDVVDRYQRETRSVTRADRIVRDILARFPWTMQDIIDVGGLSQWQPIDQFYSFLGGMFEADEIIWTGQVHNSGDGLPDMPIEHKRNIRSRNEKHFRPRGVLRYGPPYFEFTSHCTFRPGTWSRRNADVMEHKYMVIESDILSLDEIGSVFSWLHSEGHTLRAVVFSGKRSLHGWFDWPTGIALETILGTLKGLGCDPSTLRASQPVRLPGMTRRDTGKIQSLLYLDPRYPI